MSDAKASTNPNAIDAILRHTAALTTAQTRVEEIIDQIRAEPALRGGHGLTPESRAKRQRPDYIAAQQILAELHRSRAAFAEAIALLVAHDDARRAEDAFDSDDVYGSHPEQGLVNMRHAIAVANEPGEHDED